MFRLKLRCVHLVILIFIISIILLCLFLFNHCNCKNGFSVGAPGGDGDIANVCSVPLGSTPTQPIANRQPDWLRTILNDSPVNQVAAGDQFSLILLRDGRVFGIGRNVNGQLGDGSRISRPRLVEITSLGSDNAQVAAGGSHSLILKADGRVMAFGLNLDGQLGDGSTTTRSSPVEIASLGSDNAQVVASKYYSLILKADGRVMACGNNPINRPIVFPSEYYGATRDQSRTNPVVIGSLGGDNAQIAAGRDHSLILKADGRVMAFGSNNYGQLGNGSKDDTGRSITVEIASLGSDNAQVAAGEKHSLILKTDGRVLACGSNLYGQLGNNIWTDRSRPVEIASLGSDNAQVVAGSYHSLILKANGSVWGFGLNNHGQLGGNTDQAPAQRSNAVEIGALGTGNTQIAVGFYHSLVVPATLSEGGVSDRDGHVFGFGSNTSGESGERNETDACLSRCNLINRSKSRYYLDMNCRSTMPVGEPRTPSGARYIPCKSTNNEINSAIMVAGSQGCNECDPLASFSEIQAADRPVGRLLVIRGNGPVEQLLTPEQQDEALQGAQARINAGTGTAEDRWIQAGRPVRPSVWHGGEEDIQQLQQGIPIIRYYDDIKWEWNFNGPETGVDGVTGQFEIMEEDQCATLCESINREKDTYYNVLNCRSNMRRGQRGTPSGARYIPCTIQASSTNAIITDAQSQGCGECDPLESFAQIQAADGLAGRILVLRGDGGPAEIADDMDADQTVYQIEIDNARARINAGQGTAEDRWTLAGRPRRPSLADFSVDDERELRQGIRIIRTVDGRRWQWDFEAQGSTRGISGRFELMP